MKPHLKPNLQGYLEQTNPTEWKKKSKALVKINRKILFGILHRKL